MVVILFAKKNKIRIIYYISIQYLDDVQQSLIIGKTLDDAFNDEEGFSERDYLTQSTEAVTKSSALVNVTWSMTGK